MSEKKETRHYTLPDSEMLLHSRVKHDFVQDELALFTAKFPWLDQAWLDDWETETEAVNGANDDGSYVAGVGVLTEDVTIELSTCDQLLRELFIYTKLAYAGDKKTQRLFGKDTLQAARSNRKKMFDLLKLAHSLANEEPYKTNLLNKGYTQPKIDALLTSAESLSDKKTIQGNQSGKRATTTAERIKNLNKVWERDRTIKAAAQVVHPDNFAKQKIYQLYPSKTKKKEKTEA